MSNSDLKNEVESNDKGGIQKNDGDEEDEENNIIEPAYSMADMLDALSDDEEEIFVEAEEGHDLEDPGTTVDTPLQNIQEDMSTKETIVDSSTFNKTSKVEMEITSDTSKRTDSEGNENNSEISNKDKTCMGECTDNHNVGSRASSDKNGTTENVTVNEVSTNANTMGTELRPMLEENEIYESGDELSQCIPSPDDEKRNNILNGVPKGELSDGLPNSQQTGQVKLVSDICGRFHVDGVEFDNLSDVTSSHEGTVDGNKNFKRHVSTRSTTATVGEPQYENIYDVVPDGEVPGEQRSSSVSGEPKKLENASVVTSMLSNAKKAKSTPISKLVINNTNNLSSTSVSTVVSRKVACSFSSAPSVSDRIASLKVNASSSKKSSHGTNPNSSCISVTLPIICKARTNFGGSHGDGLVSNSGDSSKKNSGSEGKSVRFKEANVSFEVTKYSSKSSDDKSIQFKEGHQSTEAIKCNSKSSDDKSIQFKEGNLSSETTKCCSKSSVDKSIQFKEGHLFSEATKCNSKSIVDTNEKADNSFQFGDSISNRSFKTEVVAGTDPFANLKKVGREPSFKVDNPAKVITTTDSDPSNMYSSVQVKNSESKSLGEDVEMIENDIYDGTEDNNNRPTISQPSQEQEYEDVENVAVFQEVPHYQYMWQAKSMKTKPSENGNSQHKQDKSSGEEWTELCVDDCETPETEYECCSNIQETGKSNPWIPQKEVKKEVNPGDMISCSELNAPNLLCKNNISDPADMESSYELGDTNTPWRSKMVLEIKDECTVKAKEVQHNVSDNCEVYPDDEDENDYPREQIYENVNYINEGSYGGNVEDGSVEYVEDYDDGWSSSEFESYETTPSNTLEASGVNEKGQSIRRKKEGSGTHRHKHTGIRTSFKSPRSSDIQQMITRLGDRIGDKIDKFGHRLSKQETEDGEDEEEDTVLMEISLNMEKHPPAELPVMPYGLNELQIKRRHIISSIVSSEKNYLDSLQRIVEDYEKPLQNAKPHILQKDTIRVIFYKVKDILQCHHMFHIELSEAVKTWDEDEKIGNVFIASFSKIMVFETYSAYVNNFSVAMETTRKQARSRPAFEEFLKSNLAESTDKMSLFGLMVKPVQRFPQFILLLQDLLKHTPLDHHDRINLQMALTELENLTHRLNETKRESEMRYDAKKIVSNLVGRNSVKSDDKRYLVRTEDVLYLDIVNGEPKTKQRRVYMMSDMVLCVSVDTKDNEGSEKYKYKWHLPTGPVEVSDPSVAPSYQVRSGLGKTSVTPIKAENLCMLNPNNPHKQEVDDMLHDLPIIEQVGQLITQLRMKYEGLNCTVTNGLMRSLQVNIQQKSDVDKCIIQLLLPSSKGQEQRKYTFQLVTANRRRDWLFELENTKLSLEPKNKLGWLIPENERMFNAKMPLFIRPLLIDVTQHDTRGSRKKKFKFKVECAVPVVLPSPELPGVGIQHLWVCSGDRGRGHVTIVSLHGNRPQVVESFKSCDSPILCAELVPGYACCDDKRAFAQDTVWMSLENQSLHVRSVSEEHREDPLLTIPVDSQVMCMKYLDSKLYIGLKSGHLWIFSRDQDGIWQIKGKEVLQLGSEPITDLLQVDHSLWVACGRAVVVLDVITHYHSKGVKLEVRKKSHSISHAGETFVESIIKAGAGLVVSFRGSSLLRLYHQESMQHLQDVNVASVLNQLADGRKKVASAMRESFRKLHITYLMACKGLLWIGTSVGCVLTLPLPRLEGVPQIKGRPSVCYHAHVGPIKFLSSIYCGATQLHKPEIEESTISDIYQHSDISFDGNSGADYPSGQGITLSGVTESETDEYKGFTQSAELSGMPRALDDLGIPAGGMGSLGGGLAASKNFWVSTPNLSARQPITPKDDIHTLYGSLLRIPHADYDAELLGMKQRKSTKKGNIPGLNLVTKKATAVNARLKQIMSESPGSPQSKYATLPVLIEDTAISDSSNKASTVDSESTSSATSDIDNYLGIQSSQEMNSNSVQVSSSSQQAVGKNNAKQQNTNQHNEQQNKPLFISQSVPLGMLNNSVLGKSHMVISGGEGHINWSDDKAVDMKYEDLCLLLWQYRQ